MRPRRLWKSCGGVDGVLAGHGVGDEEDLAGVEELFEALHLVHQLFVDVEAAGGVDDEGVAAHDAGFAAGFFGEALDEGGAGGLAFLVAFVELGFNGFGDDFELLAGGGAVDVDRDEHGAMAALFEPGGELAGGGGFAGALQAGHEDDRGRLRGEFEAGRVFAEQGDELVADDLDDLLGGREGGEDFSADGFDADVLDEVADDVEVDVGFEQGYANFAQGFGDVFFRERALAAEGFEGALEFVCKVFKHRSIQVYRAACGHLRWGRRRGSLAVGEPCAFQSAPLGRNGDVLPVSQGSAALALGYFRPVPPGPGSILAAN